jgi:hypothetical protein
MKTKKQNELRMILEEQIREKEQMKQKEKLKQDEHNKKLELAIKNMNKRIWPENKSESQREKEKEEYKGELQRQMMENQK